MNLEYATKDVFISYSITKLCRFAFESGIDVDMFIDDVSKRLRLPIRQVRDTWNKEKTLSPLVTNNDDSLKIKDALWDALKTKEISGSEFASAYRNGLYLFSSKKTNNETQPRVRKNTLKPNLNVSDC
jgi:hypothetical protein